MTFGLGWVPPTPEQDVRSLLRAAPTTMAELLPEAAPESDNSDLVTVTNQLSLGACQTFSAKQAVQMEARREGLPALDVSALAVYHWLRKRDNCEDVDCGGGIGSAFEAMSALGVPSEQLCPYDVSRFADRPGPEVDRDAHDRRGTVGLNYVPIRETGDRMIELVERVATSRRGVPFGVLVSKRFCSELPRGVVEPPGEDDEIAGGHALTIVGHVRREQKARVQGSWGDFGDPSLPPGQCWFSYRYLLQAADLWYCMLASFKTGARR